MRDLLIGTDSGVFRLDGEDRAQRESGPASCALLASADPGVYCLTREGALWLHTGPGHWQQVNPQCVSEEVWALAADPRVAGRLYLGVSPALLYRSDDGGATWVTCESVKRIPGYERWTFPPPPHIPHVRSIAPDPLTPGAVYIGVEEGGVYRSSDGGETWESLNHGLYWDVHTVVPAPDGTRLYATTGAGFHRSDDGGRSWRHIAAGIDRSYTVPCVASRRTLGRLYLAAAATPPPGWRQGANAALYGSDNGGEQWRLLEGGLPPQFDRMVAQLVLDDEGRVYAAAGPELWAGREEGDHWLRVAADLPSIRTLAWA